MRTFIALAAALGLTLGAAPQEQARVVVHEWGTFTSVAGSDGASLDWRPLAGPSDLPSFVHTLSQPDRGFRHGGPIEACGHKEPNLCKGCTEGTIRMETPVLYFYSDRETTMSVKVDFPKGRITEWYPSARNVGRGIDWGGVRIVPTHASPFLTEKGDSHYYPARETDAHPVRVCLPGSKAVEHEKFLFYRGVGTFDLPLKVTLDGDRVTVKNLGKERIDQVVLFENRDGKMGYRIHCYLDGEAALERPETDRSIDQITGDLMKILTTQGLYEKEARAMVKTWRDSWFEPGLRVFYTVPKLATANILPLTLNPAPAELKRVLVGRSEIITPEMEKTISELASRLGNESIEAREAATQSLKAYGRFAEPVLKKILATTQDAEVRARIRRLIGG